MHLHATLEKKTPKKIKYAPKKKGANPTHLIFTNVFKFLGLDQ
jgi:hypothetical protein